MIIPNFNAVSGGGPNYAQSNLQQMRKLVVYIAASLDGYIAKPGDDLSFLSIVQQGNEDYGYRDFIAQVDTVVVGRRTYDWVMKQVPEFPHANKETYVITHTPQPTKGNIQFYTGDLRELVERLKAQNGKNIFCDGGAEVIKELLRHDLVDEFYISVIPILLGGGTPLFKEGIPELRLELISTKSFESGLVQLHYQRYTNGS